MISAHGSTVTRDAGRAVTRTITAVSFFGLMGVAVSNDASESNRAGTAFDFCEPKQNASKSQALQSPREKLIFEPCCCLQGKSPHKGNNSPSAYFGDSQPMFTGA